MRAHLKHALLFVSLPLVAMTSEGVLAQSAPSSATAAVATQQPSPVSQPISANVSVVDQNARSKQFHQNKQCLEASLSAEHLRNALQVCQEQPLGSSGRASCDQQTHGFDVKSQALATQSANAGCSQDAETTHRKFSSSLVQAARAGDSDAQLCYFEWAGPLSGAGDISLYKREASLYMQKAMVRGDWRMVQLLTTPPESVAHGGVGVMANLDIIGKWFTVYRADRLLMLGANEDYKKALQVDAKDAASHLTAAQINNANVWAAQEFQRHFTNSPKLSAAPVSCLNANGDAQ